MGIPIYDVARQRAKQQENANLQGQKDAISRRAAQLGGGVNGALMKQEQVASDDSAQRLQGANEAINAQEAQEVQRQREIQEGRQFQTSERLGSQGFAAEQAGLGRKFTTSEREAGQGFMSGESALQRKFSTSEREAGQGFQSEILGKQQKFATSEREAGQGYQSGEAEKQRGFLTSERQGTQEFTAGENAASRAQQADQFGRQMDLSKEQFAHEQSVDAFNMDLATKMFEKKDMLESFFDNFSMGNLGKGGGQVSDWWKGITSNGGGGSSISGGGLGDLLGGLFG